jgi:2-keto-4-pentenoate hydratase/2-oxohepta-3-ene-1,7-dioic acid hydratase in catechol pathway
MKLCRFTLSHEPERVRSGVFYDNRVYETDGENAIGLHELGKVRLLAPLGQPPSWRAFDWVRAGGEDVLAYRYRNPVALTGPTAEVDAPAGSDDLGFELRLALVVGDRGERVEAEEAPGFVLGATLVLAFLAGDMAEEDASMGLPDTRSHDLPALIGPFLVTPDEVDSLGGVFRVEVSANGHVQSRTEAGLPLSPVEAVVAASRSLPVVQGDLLALPPFGLPSLASTHLGRSLRPGDTVVAAVEGLGALCATIC